MLLEMLARKENIYSVVWVDLGWEYPAMLTHIKKVERETRIKIIRLYPLQSLRYYMSYHPIRVRCGLEKGKFIKRGFGWPSWHVRWCTREKIRAIKRYLKTIPNDIEYKQCIGFAADEGKRIKQKDAEKNRYPLIDYGITSGDALSACRASGYDWGGLYDHFGRVSCFCCPLQRIGRLKILWKHYPDLWNRIKAMDAEIPPGTNRKFWHDKTVKELERRFIREDKHGK